MASNRNLLFQGSIFRGYVSFREGKKKMKKTHTTSSHSKSRSPPENSTKKTNQHLHQSSPKFTQDAVKESSIALGALLSSTGFCCFDVLSWCNIASPPASEFPLNCPTLLSREINKRILIKTDMVLEKKRWIQLQYTKKQKKNVVFLEIGLPFSYQNQKKLLEWNIIKAGSWVFG